MNSEITPLTPAQLATEEAATLKAGYIHNVEVELDDLGNVITGGLPDETMSSRASRAAAKGKLWGKLVCKVLNLIQSNHGPRAQASDLARAQVVIATELGSGMLGQ